MSQRMPVLFFGHGNPMNAIQDNEYSRSWKKIASEIPRPQAILSVSAHWYVPEVAVTAMESPRTIHDFGGFPRELYQVQYPAPGDPALASRIQSLLSPMNVRADHEWGLDHGTWSVLCHAFPNAEIPIVQLSIHETEPAGFHYDLAKRLKPLREEGVLVVGSGNIVHNLHTYAWGKHPVDPYDWAVRFENKIRELLRSHNDRAIVDYESLGRDAMLSAPTPDHFLPLLYVIGLRENEDVTFTTQGFDGGSISMLGIRIG